MIRAQACTMSTRNNILIEVEVLWSKSIWNLGIHKWQQQQETTWKVSTKCQPNNSKYIDYHKYSYFSKIITDSDKNKITFSIKEILRT